MNCSAYTDRGLHVPRDPHPSCLTWFTIPYVNIGVARVVVTSHAWAQNSCGLFRLKCGQILSFCFGGGVYFHKLFWWCVILNFHRDVDKICALLGCYAALSGSPVKRLREHLWRRDRWIVPKRRYGFTPLRCVIAHKSANLFRWYFPLRNNCWEWRLYFRLSETRFYVYWTVHHCNGWRIKYQLVTVQVVLEEMMEVGWKGVRILAVVGTTM